MCSLIQFSQKAYLRLSEFYIHNKILYWEVDTTDTDKTSVKCIFPSLFSFVVAQIKMLSKLNTKCDIPSTTANVYLLLPLFCWFYRARSIPY